MTSAVGRTIGHVFSLLAEGIADLTLLALATAGGVLLGSLLNDAAAIVGGALGFAVAAHRIGVFHE